MIPLNDQQIVKYKTVLEYLVVINEQSYSGIGREFNITPQQFSDWIKKRRPIPEERLKALANYFKVQETVLVDGERFAKQLTPFAKTELHMLLLDQKVARLKAEGAEDEDIISYQEKKRQLQREQSNQIRLGRMAAALEQGDERVGAIFDVILDKLNAGQVDELSNKLQEGKE
ncbi:XRE family transcriptional regulator [Paenibacillus wuxiensis]|uniref:XRE family transcriptional regulator n=1 Tax=Paenibacillaceae bacterium P-4 TaxID=3160969 RepID=UPI00406B976C